MNKFISVLTASLLSILSLTACAQTSKNNPNATKDMNNKKILVAYFSHTGENYGVGNITEGNTHIIARMIGEQTGATLFEIVSQKNYPTSYNACVDVAKKEKSAKARPAIKSDIPVEDYDIIFLGYPNWWGDMPMPVYTFIESHDWTGKTVIPFCTHEGSGLSATEKYIANACTGATVLKGLAVRGTTAQTSRPEAQAAGPPRPGRPPLQAG